MQNFHDVVENAAYLHYWALSSFALPNEDEQYIYCKQDEARAHMSEQTMKFLREFFNARLISIRLRPPKVGLNPIGFFPVGHLKN